MWAARAVRRVLTVGRQSVVLPRRVASARSFDGGIRHAQSSSSSAVKTLAERLAARGIAVSTAKRKVQAKSRDYYWFSPVLRGRLNDKAGDVHVAPQSEAEVNAYAFCVHASAIQCNASESPYRRVGGERRGGGVHVLSDLGGGGA
jgi:hypothetical protein